MYKKRFKGWNARKYNEESEMKAIVRKHTERARVGKASTFKVRDQVVDIQKVFRYWERKKISVDDIVIRRAMSRTPEAVECLTPLLSPLRTPDVLATQEQILLKLQDYIRGSFDDGKWSDLRQEESIDRFVDQCRFAFHLLDNDRYLEAGQALNNAFANINTMLRSEHISTFRGLAVITSRVFEINQPEIAFTLLRQVFAMAELLLGSSHPLKVVCMWLASLARTNETLPREVLSTSLRKMADCFQEVLGPRHEESLRYRLDSIIATEAEGGFQRAEGMLRKLLRDCELSMVEHDYMIHYVRFCLARVLYGQGNFIQAKEAFQYLHSCMPHSLLKRHCLELLAWSQYRLGDTQEAVTTMREAIDLFLSGGSSEHGWACRSMLFLEDWLSELGDFDSAAQVQARRIKVQDSFKVEWL